MNANIDQYLGPKGGLWQETYAMAPWPRAPRLLLFSWSHEKNHDGDQCLGKRDPNTGIELLETFANSPLELSHGMVESSSNPPAGLWCCHPDNGLHSAFNFSLERPVFHFSSCPEVCIQQTLCFWDIDLRSIKASTNAVHLAE